MRVRGKEPNLSEGIWRLRASDVALGFKELPWGLGRELEFRFVV